VNGQSMVLAVASMCTTLDYANVRVLNDNVPRRLWCYLQ